MEYVDIRVLNVFFKDNKNLKEHLERTKKIVLPPVCKNGSMTTKWLLQVARNEVFTIPEEKFRHYRGTLRKSVTKQELNSYIIQESGMPTGFSESSLPDKEYLVDCLYSLKQDHELFKTIDDSLSLLVPEG